MNQRRDEPEDIILSQFDGIKNAVTRERLTPTQLASAVNVDIDDAKQVRRRRGYTLRSEGVFHSLYTSDTGVVLVVKDGVLGQLLPDFTHVALADGGDDPISFTDIGGTVYYSSVDVSGKILPNMTALPWGQRGGAGEWLSPVVNPTATLGEVGGKLLGRPPMARWLAHNGGRIYMADGPVLWATELYMYDYVDKTRSFMQFESRITGLAGSADGLYVGTETAVWFLSGTLAEMQRRAVVKTGCLEGSMVEVPGDFALVAGEPALQYRKAVLFMTGDGLIAGFNSGFCRNITANETLFPGGTSIVPMFRKQDGMNQYVGVMSSGGTPTSTARIGDYMDAEIVRLR